MTTQKDNHPEVTTLTVIEGNKFPRIPAFARKIYFSPETIFFNIPDSVLKIVEIKDHEKIEGEFFNTVKVFMTIDGVVHEDVLMAAVWNIQQSKELTAEQRAGYMYNAELNAFAFLRGGKIQMLPVNGRTLVDANGDALLDLDEILSDIESLIVVPKEEKKTESQPKQFYLGLPTADWKNTENFVEVLLAKLIGPIGNVYTTNDFRLDADNGILVINDFTVDFDSKDPLFAVLTEHMHLQKVSTLLSQNFANLPSIGQISVYDLYGGVSVIFTPGFIALISAQLAKQLQTKKDMEDLKASEEDINPVQNPQTFMQGIWDVYALQANRLGLERNTRIIRKDGQLVAGLEPTEKLVVTTLAELVNVGIGMRDGNLIVSNGEITYLYDLGAGLVHINDQAELSQLLVNIGVGVNTVGRILNGKYHGYAEQYTPLYQKSTGTPTTQSPFNGTWTSEAFGQPMNRRAQVGGLFNNPQMQWPYSETSGNSAWFNHTSDVPAMNFGNIAPAQSQLHPWGQVSSLPNISGMYSQPTPEAHDDGSDVMEVEDIVKSIVLTDLTNDDIKTIMAALITKM